MAPSTQQRILIMKHLIRQPGALPFFIAVFLNAFVDLGHKIVIQNTIFKIYDGPEQVILTAIVNALILLPFIILFSPAGFLSDKLTKTKVMRLAAWAAVALTTGITLCYAMGWFWAAFAMTFLLAAQSAFYSPAKYGFIKTLFGKEKLAEANSLVQTISIVAILAGTFIFSVFFEMLFPADAISEAAVLKALIPLGLLLVGNALCELVMMYKLPELDEPKTEKQFELGAFLTGKTIKKDLMPVISNQAIWLSVIGLSVFWSIGQVMLAAFPSFVKAELGETNTITIQAILAATGLGIAIGSFIAGKVSKNYIETGLIPLGAVGIAIGLSLLPNLSNITAYAIDFFVIGFMGGIFIVPLNAIIQFRAKDRELGQVLAGNNLFQNIAMFSFLGLTVLFSILGLESKHLLYVISIVAFIGGFYTIYKLPQSFVRFILTLLMTRSYKINVLGLKSIPNNKGVLLLGNHISWVDWAILQIAYPRQIYFVMAKSIYNKKYLKPFLNFFGCIPIEPGKSSKTSLEKVTQLLNEGKVVGLFPEGMISKNGHLAEFKHGYERAVENANDDVVIQPFYLRGLWGSRFSRASDHHKTNRSSKWNRDNWRREVIVAFGEPISKETKAESLKQKVFDLSVKSWNDYADQLPSITSAWIEQCKTRANELCMADSIGGELTSGKALAGAISLSQKIKRISLEESNIGILLPTGNAGMLTNMAVLLLGKTVVNINYTASKQAVSSAISQANIRTIYTSKKFISKLEKKGIDLTTSLETANLVYLEDIGSEITTAKKLFNYLCVRLLPKSLIGLLFSKRPAIDDTAAILFSSGSEGAPKGVVLSHKNIMANLRQVADVLNTEIDDTIIASLPLFHAFGLTVTQFMPLVEGIPVVSHADPTDALGIGKIISQYKATILCGTSTFLRLYTRNSRVHPLMFDSLRIVVSGAEKLDPNVHKAFKDKFKKDIYEGYGATETTPVASVNLPDLLNISDWKVQQGTQEGTVGMPLPGTSFKIVSPDTFDELPIGEDGMILIGGAQVMQGYLNNPEKTDQVVKLMDGMRWYVSGDKGHINKDGFLTIIDRYSRFAKIGGEMVSLSEVEATLSASLGDNIDESHEFIAVNIPDEKKGERIIIITNSTVTLEAIRQLMIENKCNPLHLPSGVRNLDELPKLGSGKTDFARAKEIALT